MTVNDAVNRGVNFFAVGTFAILATSIFHGLSMPHVGHRATEIAFGMIAVVAVAWYLTANHRYERSLVPLALLILAVLANLVGIVITFGGLVPGGSDFGIMIFLIEVCVVHAWQFTAGAMTREPTR